MRAIIHMIEVEHTETYPYGNTICHVKGKIANQFVDLFQYTMTEPFNHGGIFTATKDIQKVTCKNCLKSMYKRKMI